MSILSSIHYFSQGITQLGQWIGLLSLRLILGWEYLESGLEKWNGSNWFAEIQAKFPAPLDSIPVHYTWLLVTGLELLGAIALILGLATRTVAFALWVLTAVALVSVHWPEHWTSVQELAQGYVITDQGFGNFKLPLIFMAMLWPLMLMGAGRLSLDAGIKPLLQPQRNTA